MASVPTTLLILMLATFIACEELFTE